MMVSAAWGDRHTVRCQCQTCQQSPEPWGETPRWHPYRWFGLDLRKQIIDYDISDVNRGWWWHYGRSRVVAHELLRDAYAVDVDPREIRR